MTEEKNTNTTFSVIEGYSSELSLLSKEDIHYKIFRSFFGMIGLK